MPEVNRNRNIGEVGANMNSGTFKKYLQAMNWAEHGEDDFGDLHYLEKAKYEENMASLISKAEIWTTGLKDANFEAGKVRISLFQLNFKQTNMILSPISSA